MSRINTNVQSLVAQRVLGQNNFNLSQSLERLSTGLRINRGKDDPAGLIASENLRAELTATKTAIGNAERADQVANIAEGGLEEISGLLVELQGLVTMTANSAGLSDDEKEANQLQIDSILQTVDRIASTTAFQGIKLLNGNFDYNVSGVNNGISDVQVNGAKFDGSSLAVDVVVTQSAQQGGLFLSMGATSVDIGATSSFTIEITGSLGSRELSFSSGATLADVATTINNFSDITGVVAAASGTGLSLNSEQFGSDEFVSVRMIDDGGIGTASNVGIYNFQTGDGDAVLTSSHTDFAPSGAAGDGIRDAGQDLAGTINGIQATSDGKKIRINTDFLDVQLTLSTTQAQQVGAVGSSSAFTIAGGGADFMLGGTTNLSNTVSLGIGNVAIRKLGNSDLGFLDDIANGKDYNLVDSDGRDAQKIVTEAIKQVSSLRGRLGAFQKNTIGATIRSLGIAVENTAAAESVIRDADFASETAELTRSQILVSASTNILAISNSQPQNVLSLIG